MPYPLPRLLWLWLLLGVLARPAAAQPDPVKFGAVDASAFDASAYKGAADAPAVVLCDYGRTRIEGGSQDGFRIVFERVTRLLVRTKAGYDYATVEIPLYRRDGQEEQLLNLRGFTYNLQGGQIEKQKLASSAIFHEQVDARHARRKFTLPGVHEGSIIEYAYTLKSDFVFQLPDWQFQYRALPVVWSEYRTVVPAFYIYKEIPRGYLPYALHTQEIVPYSTIYRGSVNDGRGTTNSQTSMTRLTTNAVSNRWVMRDVPAFREEAFMTTPRDYLAGLEFELHLTQFDPTRPQAVTSTWEKITSELLKHEQFGELLARRDLAGEFSNASPLTAAARQLPARFPDPAARAAAALELVRQAVRYTGEESMYARTPQLSRLVEQHQGNAAEVNLLLIHTLRDADLNAHPLLLSTRAHGRIQQEVPVVTQFNYVVAYVDAPGYPNGLLLDATDPISPAGTLPERCLNGHGRLLAPAGRWVPLAPAQRYLHLTTARLALSEQGALQGNVRVEYGGYAGLAERTRLAAAGEKEYLLELQRQHPDWQLTRAAVQRVAEAAAPLLLDLDLRVAAAPDQPWYLPVMPLFASTQNPFLSETRAYPVDLGMGREYLTTVLLTLPTGYKLDELPARLALELPGAAGRFAFDASLQGQVLQLTSRLTLSKPEYKPGEYAALRELYTRALAKHAEPLVLRRTR